MPHRIEIAKAKLCPSGSKKIGFVWHYALASFRLLRDKLQPSPYAVK
jgi:hypothetical protein